MTIQNAASAATVALCLLYGPASVAAAQTSDGTPQPVNDSPAAAKTADAAAPIADEILVTAQKRTERLLDVPISITALSSAAIVQSGAKNLTELQGIAPGVFFSGNTGYSVTPIAIRGTSGTGNALADEPVAVYVDGIFQNAQSISTNDFADVRSIEVVRGPQGTLQGRNSTAGAILIRTNDPEDKLGGYIRVSAADPAEYRAQAALTGPIAANLSARISLGYVDDLGWARNTFTGTRAGSQNSTSVRATLLYDPGALRLRFSAGYSSADSSVAIARVAQTIVNPTGQAVILGVNATPTVPLPAAQFASILDGNIALNVVPKSRITNPYGTLEASYDFGGVELVSLTGISRLKIQGQNDSDGMASTDRYGFNLNTTSYDSYSEELRLQSTGDRPLSYILGTYFSHIDGYQDIQLYNITFTAPRNQYLQSIANQANDAIAVFGDATYKLTHTISATAGVRYTDETKVFTRVSGFYNSDTSALYPFLPNGTYSPPKATFNNVSYRAKLAWQPGRGQLFYLSYSNGFKSGGFNALGNDPVFQPETLKSLEIGAKLQLFDRALTVTTAAYHNIYSNLQVTAGVPAGGVAIYNAAQAKIDGGELEARLNLGDHFSLSGNVAYTDGRYSNFPRAQAILGNIVDASGNRLARSPEWQYYIQPTWTADLSADWTVEAQASYRWRSLVVFFPTDQAAATLQGPAYGELGLRLSTTNRPLDLTVALFATNLANSRAITNEQSLFNYPVASFNKPRSIGIQVEKKF